MSEHLAPGFLSNQVLTPTDAAKAPAGIKKGFIENE